MRAENYLQMMMDFYPDLFPTRKHCLDHLFCTIGNGLEWKNGELVDMDDDEAMTHYVLKKDVEKARPRRTTEEEFWRNFELEQQMVKSFEVLGQKYKRPLRYIFKWYPLSKEYSYLYNYPDDIKEDWLALIEETKEYLKEDGIDF